MNPVDFDVAFALLAVVESVDVVVDVDDVGVAGSTKLPADLLKIGYGKIADIKSKQT